MLIDAFIWLAGVLGTEMSRPSKETALGSYGGTQTESPLTRCSRRGNQSNATGLPKAERAGGEGGGGGGGHMRRWSEQVPSQLDDVSMQITEHTQQVMTRYLEDCGEEGHLTHPHCRNQEPN